MCVSLLAVYLYLYDLPSNLSVYLSVSLSVDLFFFSSQVRQIADGRNPPFDGEQLEYSRVNQTWHTFLMNHRFLITSVFCTSFTPKKRRKDKEKEKEEDRTVSSRCVLEVKKKIFSVSINSAVSFVYSSLGFTEI